MRHNEPLAGRRLAVIGAGPIGLEAALYGMALGASVQVYERGAVARNVSRWGHIELFSPFGLNHTQLGRRVLEAEGRSLPDDDRYQTGAEWRETYLIPLAESAALAAAINSGCRVTTVGRGELLKGDHIGDGLRSDHPFRLLIESEAGERYVDADVVLDCSGTYDNPNWLGRGGVPALGERGLRGRIAYHPLDVAGAHRDDYAGCRTLLVGGGYSAATTALALASLAGVIPETRVLWVTRTREPVPILPIENDALARRAALTDAANRLVQAPEVEWGPGRSGGPGTTVLSIQPLPHADALEVVLEGPLGTRREQVDRIIANVGYGPDNSIYRELQIHECYASRAPMKLAAALLAASADAGGDCLKLSGFGPEVLANPEPGFFILGMKSYGTNSTFLLGTGYEQVRDAFCLITGDAGLDLYSKPDLATRV